MTFFDTNVLVYSVDAAQPAKAAVARPLLEEAIAGETLVLSTQVLQEFYDVVLRKRLLKPEQAVAILQLWAQGRVVPATPELLFRAFELQQRQRISVWDALIVQAALDAGCTVLYSEDLHHGLRIGDLEIVNPFGRPPAVHEPATPYRELRSTARGTAPATARSRRGKRA